jgi:soluble lytic murein transglycosylase-like protein
MLNRINKFPILFAVLAGACRSPAADAPKSVVKAAEDAAKRQRQAVSAMAASLEAQRRSLQTQTGRLPAASFFTLPPLTPPRPVSGSSVPFLESAAACPALPDSELEALVDEAALREDLEPDLLRSVIRQESADRPCAVSSKGAMGLMQLMPATALQLGVGDAFDPKQNVDGGARFLKQLLNLYGGDLSLALGAFNAGPGKVNQAGGLPDYPETVNYVQKVLSLLPFASH